MRPRLTTACALLVALSAPAFAQEAAPPVPPPQIAAVPESFADPAPLGDAELAEMSGRANYYQFDTQALTRQALTASSRDNSVTGQTVGSGDVTIGSDAFSGFNGIGNFVVNTGHNNVLQGSLSVQVVVVPTPGS